ncbi:MAG: polysaccharide pyruvyl transferase family protein [Bacteroidales bacterium]|nr:polysaccharide pyruvyl transferase family protein [Bacteroidales bacterium]
MKKNIVLVGLLYDTNLGDQAIFHATRFYIDQIFIQHQINNIDIRMMDMTGRDGVNSNAIEKKIKQSYAFRITRKIFKKSKRVQKFLKRYVAVNSARKNNKLFLDSNTLAVIFVGGGIIKYQYQYFHLYINEILKVTNKNNIPVMFSAVGIEGYNQFNKDCLLLRKALQQKCVKMITTRDDLDLLQKHYCLDIPTAKVADPVYGISKLIPKHIKRNNPKVIGLGVVRENLFINNNISFSKKDMLLLWKSLFDALKNSNYECKIFCNGLKADYQFGLDLLEYMGIPDSKINDYLVPCPKTTNDLVDIISSFDGIIVGRLHASIIAYSYGISSIGLVWNNKQKMFGEMIGYPERFIEKHNFNVSAIMEVLNKAIEEGYSKIDQESFSKTTIYYLEHFINQYLIKKEI